jgi:Zn-dependent protease
VVASRRLAVQEFRRDPSVRAVPSWHPSSTFLALIAAFLACAVWMLARPDHERWLVFPFVLIGFLIGVCLHEFGHAIIAYYCGDTTVREKGYLTLNPLRYTDVFSSLLFPLLIMAIGGIGLPGAAVFINHHLLRRRVDSALVSAGGPLATAAVLAVLMIVLNSVVGPTGPQRVLYASLAFLALLQVTMLVFNLIPCPGLDGWGIIEPFLPEQIRRAGRRFGLLGPVILVVALFVIPGVGGLFWDAVYAICALVGLNVRMASIGFQLFQIWH